MSTATQAHWSFDPASRVWDGIAEDTKDLVFEVKNEEDEGTLKKNSELIQRPKRPKLCPICEAPHRRNNLSQCDNSEYEAKNGVCPNCFLELPVTGICGNCE